VRPRALASALVLAGVLTSGASAGPVGSAPEPATAAPCVRFVASNWEAPGNDNYMPQLNQEWVRIKNTCGSAKGIGGWRIHDYKAIHTYRFPSGFSVPAGASVTLRSGQGTNSASVRYWQRSYGAVWNNSAPERAYLKNGAGTLVHSWVQAGW
jgi:hypothetical protein